MIPQISRWVMCCAKIIDWFPEWQSMLKLIMAPKGSHMVISVSVRPSQIIIFWWVVVCVRFSSETDTDTNLPREQCRFATYTSFWPSPSMTAGQGHKILQFCEFRCLMGSSLCSLLLRNYSTKFSNDDTNQLREQCRFATYTSLWPSPLHDCRSRSQNTSILWI